MHETELRILRLHAPLAYRSLPTAGLPAFPFGQAGSPVDGDEEVAFYDPDAVLRFDRLEGPRALSGLPAPRAFARNADGADSRDREELGQGTYGFLQGSAFTERELLRLIETFARQAWWERQDLRGPYIVRRVFEDGRWAAQIWREVAGNGADS